MGLINSLTCFTPLLKLKGHLFHSFLFYIPGLNITVATRVRLFCTTQDRSKKPVRKINVCCYVVLLCTADAIKMKINIFTIVLPLFIFTDRVNSANLQNIIGQSRGSCPTGSVGEFATFGFLTFMITLLNTILNLGKSEYLIKDRAGLRIGLE